MTIRQQLEDIIARLTAALPDADKVDRGSTGDPGTRVRAAALTARECLQELRVAVVDARKAKEA